VGWKACSSGPGAQVVAGCVGCDRVKAAGPRRRSAGIGPNQKWRQQDIGSSTGGRPDQPAGDELRTGKRDQRPSPLIRATRLRQRGLMYPRAVGGKFRSGFRTSPRKSVLYVLCGGSAIPSAPHK